MTHKYFSFRYLQIEISGKAKSLREWEQGADPKAGPQVGFTAVSDAFLVTVAELLVDRAAPFSTTGEAHWLNKR